jgi:Ca2+-binding EF-hand superfamily protein
MNKKGLLVIMLISMFTIVQSFAQEQQDANKPKRENMFAKLDTNADGKLSKAEAYKAEKGKLNENFAAIDVNKDGFIDKPELKAYKNAKRAERTTKKSK